MVARRRQALTFRLEIREVSCKQYLAICLQSHTPHIVVRTRIKSIVQAPVGIQSRDPVPGGGCDCAIGLESGETTPNQDSAIRLRHYAPDPIICAGIEAVVEAAVGVHSRNAVARGGRVRTVGLEGGEGSAEQDLAIRLQGHAIDVVVRSGIKIGVHGAVGVYSCDAIAGDHRRRAVGLECGEPAAEKHLSIRLDGHTDDRTVRMRIEIVIERSVDVDPCETVARGGRSSAIRLETGEIPAKQHLAIRLNQHAPNGVVRVGVEDRIQGAVGIESRDVVPWCAQHGTKISREDRLPIRLHRRDKHGPADLDLQ